MKRIAEIIPSYGHDEHFLRGGREFLSPKRLLTGHCEQYFSRKDPKQSYLDRQLNNKDSFAFLPKALQLGYTGQETLLQDAWLRKRYEVYPYQLMCRIQKNRIPEEKDIPAEMILCMKDDPLFLFCMALIRMAPEERRKYLSATPSGGLMIRSSQEWPEKTAEAEFLRAIRRASDVNSPRPLCMSFPDSLQDPMATEIFEQIKFAADRGYPAAQYLIGKFYFHSDLPESYQTEMASGGLQTAEKYLTSAAKRGSLPAALLLCRAKLSDDFPNYQAVLPLLEDLCRQKIGEAFYLKAETLLRLERKAEALAAAKQAVGNGDHRGWQFLALHGGSAEQHFCWRQFIAADREARKQDVHDFYWPEPYREYLKWEESGPASDASSLTLPTESPETSKTAPAGTSETGSAVSSKKSSRKKEKGRSKIKIREK